ncbi:hypothetical protein [Methanobacterium spitsbergense]|uniref:Uncharacterized protein n=1 Tax=Methanobacterium spitsbergense TaxID=2874285 RepID=A0A8T5UMG5_9EURY|nr:hypothetical protein [Methanobacterium spitsbergense]MBZ2165048.1 hypothetical protein [Methanobacterium spitsbergense]
MVCAGIQILVQSVFTPPPNTSTGPSLDFNRNQVPSGYVHSSLACPLGRDQF